MGKHPLILWFALAQAALGAVLAKNACEGLSGTKLQTCLKRLERKEEKLSPRPRQTQSLKEFFDTALVPKMAEFREKKAARLAAANKEVVRTEAAKESAKESAKEGVTEKDTKDERRQKMENTKKQIMENKEKKKKEK